MYKTTTMGKGFYSYRKAVAWAMLIIFEVNLIAQPAVALAQFEGWKPTVRTYGSPMAYLSAGDFSSVPKATKIEPEKSRHSAPLAGRADKPADEGFGGGPTQPEMQSFQSVGSSNMVDLFSGDFSYNIPLLDVGGYPVNLHYQSGITMDQEASWVGLGWNINPGVISRNKRGLPDDFMGGNDQVTNTQSIKPNRTVGVKVAGDLEILGKGTVEASLGLFHNTYKGWGTETGINANISSAIGSKGTLSAGLSLSNNSQTGLDLSPTLSFQIGEKESNLFGSFSIASNYNSRVGIQTLQISGQMTQSKGEQQKTRYSISEEASATISFSKPSYTPRISLPITSTQYAFTGKLGTEHKVFHPNGFISGYSSTQQIEDEDKTLVMPGYGYLYFEKAKGTDQALYDLNREKDIPYSEESPNIAVPIYTYDTYSISGEGTGGMFRPYRSDIGFLFDHAMSTKSKSLTGSIDLGFGDIFHGGVDIHKISAITENRPWRTDNAMASVLGFRESDTSFESVYFKNPGEKTLVDEDFLNAIGDENLVRVDLSPGGQNQPGVFAARSLTLFQRGRAIGKKWLSSSSVRRYRDRRTQVISYLNAGLAAQAGLDKKIKSFFINEFPSSECNTNYDLLPRTDTYRQSNHLSEITVLNADGRRYVYGVPVYNFQETEVTMAVPDNGDPVEGLVSYTPGVDNSVYNNQGKDGYFSNEKVSAYAHSFLLSGILSPDYVDLTGDGISSDDIGDAIKFNYSRLYGPEKKYKWRAPYFQNEASYSPGLKTDNRDGKGSYAYGEREYWLLNSIESKTMIATFVLETDSVREDGFGVKDENGGIDTAQKLYRLKEINLYTKADFVKHGPANAKPIKTVHFEYDYELCQQNPSNDSLKGKLTLKRIWFTYNKNNKGKLNPYIFTYGNNPNYQSGASDRWGNYKDHTKNPGPAGQELSNADYPYTTQVGTKGWDSAAAANNAAAWTLSEIKLPSGGKLKVTYESDDYAYVQNKRAMQFFELAGFGSSSSSVLGNTRLYPAGAVGQDYQYMFVKINGEVSTREEVRQRFLDGVTQLYFKVMVSMPADIWGSGYEVVPGYAEFEDYGVWGDPGDSTIWIKLKPAVGSESPIATAAIQFLRLNLPSKAYPYSEPGDNFSVGNVINMLATIGGNITQSINGFNNDARRRNRCGAVRLERSLVRLDNPTYHKFGGGLRVKKIEVYDNWNQMTGQTESKYGQEYDYTTTQMIGGEPTVISSGVASYEPGVGGDENPFHVPFRLYREKVGVLAPSNYLYVEEPFAETFFPGPSVGYSKVTVRSIHKDKKSATGREESEFYTTRDFPTLVEITALDNDSRKRYSPKLANLFKFNAKRYITLSQGFKVELNDMNGKPLAQSSYSNNDLEHPISYTKYYYRLKNDASGTKRLSNEVMALDSSTGTIDTAAIMGKDVELMVDVREQTSKTISGSVEANVDLTSIGIFPAGFFSKYNFPTSETDRYRSIAVLKVINKYGILDSVIHMEKGSVVSTRDVLYDGQTGQVLLNQTSNEFNDPVYNFTYPAHWAYSGLDLAYKNIQATYRNVRFQQGKMYYMNGRDSFPVSGKFESGDELLVYGQHLQFPSLVDTCQDGHFIFLGPDTYKRVWAIEAARGVEGDQGIYFIDKDGNPYSGAEKWAMIIRSGKRNMAAVPVGTVTMLHNPIKEVGGVRKVVIDSTSAVVAASAARFKDLWRVDSTLYAKDTIVIGKSPVQTLIATIPATAGYSIAASHGDHHLSDDPTYPYFEGSSFDLGEHHSDGQRKSWMLFDIGRSQIPQGAIIKKATLTLAGVSTTPHLNNRDGTNAVYLRRVAGPWIGKMIPNAYWFQKGALLGQYWNKSGIGAVDYSTQVFLEATTPDIEDRSGRTPDVTSMTQAMLNDYYALNYDASIMIELQDPTGDKGDNLYNRQSYTSYLANDCNGAVKNTIVPDFCHPAIVVEYYPPCSAGVSPSYETSPSPGYYCYDSPKDTLICKPNIVDSAVNPYRWGILGNWRMDRAYTYYDPRNETDPSQATNVRTDGTIQSFEPYWAFGSTLTNSGADTLKWVWNSQMTLFNQKGFEIENNDPLGRYNSGQYGYLSTLPTAVAQNSRKRNVVFEGFEDYGYSTDTCAKCEAPRFADFVQGGGSLVDTLNHTGKYSLRLSGNQTSTTSFSVVSDSMANLEEGLSIIVDSILSVDTLIVGEGTGLMGIYTYNGARSVCRSVTDPVINMNWDYGAPTGCPTNWFQATWTGKIQPKYSDYYTFYKNSDDGAGVSVKINGVWNDLIPEEPGNYRDHDPATDSDPHNKTPVYLQAGKLYDIKITFKERKERAKMTLFWACSKFTRQVVPQSCLYLPSVTDMDVADTKILDSTWCIRLRSPKPIHVLNPRYAPIRATKIVVSAWVRQEGECATGNYPNVRIDLAFNDGVSTIVNLSPSGPVIEGWQRIEDTLTIPATASNMEVRLKATSSTPVFFDDLRIHPYNSNIKAFVYNPVNIRLMAELDENNYATFYEYDDDGTLIRVKKETERGIKTIKETRSALLKVQ